VPLGHFSFYHSEAMIGDGCYRFATLPRDIVYGCIRCAVNNRGPPEFPPQGGLGLEVEFEGSVCNGGD